MVLYTTPDGVEIGEYRNGYYVRRKGDQWYYGSLLAAVLKAMEESARGSPTLAKHVKRYQEAGQEMREFFNNQQ